MRACIEEGEWYPVISATFKKDNDFFWREEESIEVSEDFYKRYKKVMKDFDALQVEMEKILYPENNTDD